MASSETPVSETGGPDPAKLGVGLIALFCWLLSGYLLWTGWQAKALADAAPRFEQATGRVADAGVKSRGGTQQNSARVVISYEVAGKAYEFQSNGQDLRLRFSGDAQALLAAYPIDREVEVHYDPQAPQRATLTQDVQPGRAFASGWVTLALSLGFSVWAWRRSRAQVEAEPSA